MEIGSFIELELPRGREFHRGERDIIRLNSGRAAIYHAFRLTGCSAVYIPFYQCDSVRDFLIRKGCCVKYYSIDENFDIINLSPSEDEAVLIVNYYGIMSENRMKSLAEKYRNVIIDNSQAFFAPYIKNAFNIYSARKFIGVPDGAYVTGDRAERFREEYPQGYSSQTSLFLLERIEYGCEGRAYESRSVNERRIDSEDVMLMSPLTRRILDGADSEGIISKRRENFEYASSLFGSINRIDPTKYYGDDCVPMVYPLVYEDDTLLDRMLAGRHFQGRWWSYLLDEMPQESFEYYLSRYILPVTIDQRYGKEEINYIGSLVR